MQCGRRRKMLFVLGLSSRVTAINALFLKIENQIKRPDLTHKSVTRPDQTKNVDPVSREPGSISCSAAMWLRREGRAHPSLIHNTLAITYYRLDIVI